MPFPHRPCHHETRQTSIHTFECYNCGMMFFGVERSHPDISRIIESAYNERMDEVGRLMTSMNIPVTHVDLGSMPQDIIFMKAHMEEMEKALSLFSEVLKDAVQA